MPETWWLSGFFRILETFAAILLGVGVRYLRQIAQQLVLLNKRTSTLEGQVQTQEKLIDAHARYDDEVHWRESERVKRIEESVDFLTRGHQK